MLKRVFIIALFLFAAIQLYSLTNKFQSIYLSDELKEESKSTINKLLKTYESEQDRNEDLAEEEDDEDDQVFPKHPLALSKEDIRLTKVSGEAGAFFYDLIIKKKPHIGSVLLTNHYWGTSGLGRVKEYGLRSLQPLSINRNEKRLYKNMFIGEEQSLYFLVDSSPEKDVQFGQAFRIRIPLYIIYGYKQSKEIYGIIRVRDGIKINIRTFSRKHTDYKGKYYDNPIGLVLSKGTLGDGINPSITKLEDVIDDDYLTVYVEYQSDHEFFKTFLIREDSEQNFTEIDFSKHKEDKNAVLIEAFYKGRKRKTVRANIYFRRGSEDKKYHIIAMSKNSNYSAETITAKVPKMGKLILNTTTDTMIDSKKESSRNTKGTDGEYWYNEGDLIR